MRIIIFLAAIALLTIFILIRTQGSFGFLRSEFRSQSDGHLGTLLNILGSDTMDTIALAALGATVSFFIPILWKWLIKRLRERRVRRQGKY